MELKFTTQRPFGVEFEYNQAKTRKRLAELINSANTGREVSVQDWWPTYSNEHWVVKTDASCGNTGNRSDGGGFEVATFIAKGHQDLKKIARVIGKFVDNGVEVNDFCGMHIHAQAKDYSEEMLKKAALYWVCMERIILQAVPPRRRGNKHCKTLCSLISSDLEQNFSMKEFWNKILPLDSSDRYKKRTLNYTNCLYNSRRSTIELRLPECSLSEEDVKNWVRLFVHYVSNVKNLEDIDHCNPFTVKETLCGLYLDFFDTEYTMSLSLFETKIWFLKRILYYADDSNCIDESSSILKSIIDDKINNDIVLNILGDQVYSQITGS